jgi:uncharacterized protein YdeI (YjbR/CyaY-like superfamily)
MARRISAKNRQEWRSWLEAHHARETEVWLSYFKKSSGKPTVSYRESVEEALCFGWIDGIRRSIDQERYCHRFTPRKTDSKWSPLNIRLARELIEQGQMTPAGLAAFERRKEYDPVTLANQQGEGFLPPEIEQALRATPSAWRNFNALSPAYRRQYAGWLSSAKRAATREKRLAEAIRLLEQNQKLGMK